MLRRRSQLLVAVVLASAGILALWRFAGSRPAAASGPLRIVVQKAARRLTVYSGGRAARTYRIALGRRPVGPKQREGDGRTPEGPYRICAKNARSQFHLSLQVSYPNQADADAGLKAGLIGRAEYSAIVAASRRRRVPPQHTRLGGDIFIHGGGSATDWTAGCIALEDRDIEDLYALTPVGTPVEIAP